MDDMSRTIDLATLLPPVSRDSDDIQEVMRIENVDHQALWDALVDVFWNQFIETMNYYGCRQWESIFEVSISPSDTLRTRRERIKKLLYGLQPFTMLSFQTILDRIYGDGNVTVHCDGDKYEFWLNISDTMLYKINDIREYAERIVPKNLLILTQYLVKAASSFYIAGHLRIVTGIFAVYQDSASVDTLTIPQYSGGYVRMGQIITV